MLTPNNYCFPMYKLNSYENLKTNPLGLITVTTKKGELYLDNKVYEGSLGQRRAKLIALYGKKKIYPLKEQVNYLRQLVKYKSGTVFIDDSGTLLTYQKTRKYHLVKSYAIKHVKQVADRSFLISMVNYDRQELVHDISPYAKYASIMFTPWGPMLYDLTSEYHESVIRQI